MTLALLSVIGVLATGLVPAAPAPSCADTLLNDWYDGSLDGTYAPECYRDALQALPEDVRVYTTAVDDISRALRQRLAGEEKSDGAGSARSLSGVRRAQSSTKAAPARSDEPTRVAVDETGAARRPPLPLLLLVTLVLVLAVGISGTTIARRLRRRA